MTNQNPMYSHGFNIAKLLCDFVKFAEARAQYPVKLLMRDAEPISYTAKKLTKLGLAKTEKWQDVILDRAMMTYAFKPKYSFEHENSENIKLYLEQNGIMQNHTQIDTGYLGSIPKAIYNFNPNIKVQSIYIYGNNNVARNKEPHFHGSSKVFIRSNTTAPCLVLERAPKLYDIDLNNFVKRNDTVVFAPNFCCENFKNHKAYYAGLDDGIENWKDNLITSCHVRQ